MKRNNYGRNKEYVVLGSDGMIDISTGKPAYASEEADGYSDGFTANKKSDKPTNKKKKIMKIEQ